MLKMRWMMSVLVVVMVMGCSTATSHPDLSINKDADPDWLPDQELKRVAIPVVYLAGDSTVKCGRGDGGGGLWGWGSVFDQYFDPAKAEVSNHAIGGRSSRTFRTQGRYDKIVDVLKPGDYVLIQFGHNDGGPMATGRARASIKGNGEETREVTLEATGEQEIVHSFGWYIRQDIKEAKARGAIPVVCSLVPRAMVKDGKAGRNSGDYALWAKQAAQDEGAAFIDLNEIAARHYDEIAALHPDETGDSKSIMAKYFVKDHTHTNRTGAYLNAECVIAGVKALKLPVAECLNEKGQAIEPADASLVIPAPVN